MRPYFHKHRNKKINENSVFCLTLERATKNKKRGKSINKINNPLAWLTKKKRGRTQMNKIKSEKEDITSDATEIQKIIMNNYKLKNGKAR